jgi:antirestriction protein ArdC
MIRNIRQELTDMFVAAIESGTPPWRAGWTMAGPPINGSTNRPYTGLNRILLMQAVAESNGENRFMTLKQAAALGYKIRTGAKALRIVRVAEVDRKPDDKVPQDGEVVAEDQSKRLILKVHSVFSGKDVEGLPPMETPAPTIAPVEAAQRVIDGMKATGLVILEGGDKAAYFPNSDTIRMPDRWRFKGGSTASGAVATAEWCSVLLHEIGHSTGHAKRMSRKDLANGWGTLGYAREELRVEIASAFLGQELQIPMAESLVQSHAAYLASWIEVLKKDPQEIIRASADAQRIADYLKDHALTLNATREAKADLTAVELPTPVPGDKALPPAPTSVVAANEEKPRRRRAGMRM